MKSAVSTAFHPTKQSTEQPVTFCLQTHLGKVSISITALQKFLMELWYRVPELLSIVTSNQSSNPWPNRFLAISPEKPGRHIISLMWLLHSLSAHARVVRVWGLPSESAGYAYRSIHSLQYHSYSQDVLSIFISSGSVYTFWQLVKPAPYLKESLLLLKVLADHRGDMVCLGIGAQLVSSTTPVFLSLVLLL